MKQTVTITGENINVVVNPSGEAAQHSLSKAEKRIAALKAAGVDVSMYFPLGDDKVVRIEDGNAIPVDMEDDTIRQVVKGGYINHYKLFRRWVMPQMFHMLYEMKDRQKSFNEVLQRKGYEYSWHMLENELVAQSKMYKHKDMQNYEMRNRWFSNATASSMAEDYIRDLHKYINSKLLWRSNAKGNKVPKHTCKGVHYIRFNNENIFVADIEKKIFTPLYNAFTKIQTSWTITDLLSAVQRFNRLRKRLNWHTKQSSAFIDAYKGSGAYFTMRNLILFHGARFQGMPTEKASLDYLENKAREYADCEGWKLLGVMKQLISDSGISIEGKLKDWSIKRSFTER